MTLSSAINITVKTTLGKTLMGVAEALELGLTNNRTLATGTGNNQADKVFVDQRTLSASSSEDLDLAAVLTDAYGDVVTFVRVKAIIVKAASGNTNNVLVGGASSAQMINWVGDATDVIVVRPGGIFLLACNDATAYPVTATTGDLLKIANSSSGTSVTYDIIIIGASA